jgi:hypothetical protein
MGFRALAVHVLSVLPLARSSSLVADQGLLVDKTGQWKKWYERAIPHAEGLYAVYLKERAEEEGQ